MLKDNITKIGIGFILNMILLCFIMEFHFIIVSIIQMVFFTLLYTVIDKITNHNKRKRFNDNIFN